MKKTKFVFKNTQKSLFFKCRGQMIPCPPSNDVPAPITHPEAFAMQPVVTRYGKERMNSPDEVDIPIISGD